MATGPKARLKHGLKHALARRGWIIERHSRDRDFLRRLDSMESPLQKLIKELADHDASQDLFSFIVRNQAKTRARSFDDLFAWWALATSRSPFYLDIGCWDPVYLNNSLLLEQELGWPGIVVEASAFWWPSIERERSATLVRAAVVPSNLRGTALTIDPSGVSSAQIQQADSRALAGNTVPGLSLMDIITRVPDTSKAFMSLDVEGGEVDMLSEIELADTPICALSVEVLAEEDRIRLGHVMDAQGYALMLPALSHYNQWYVRTSGV